MSDEQIIEDHEEQKRLRQEAYAAVMTEAEKLDQKLSILHNMTHKKQRIETGRLHGLINPREILEDTKTALKTLTTLLEETGQVNMNIDKDHGEDPSTVCDPEIIYHSPDRQSEAGEIGPLLTHMRKGKIREIVRYQRIDSLWAVRVRAGGTQDTNIKVVKHEQDARGLKVIHNV